MREMILTGPAALVAQETQQVPGSATGYIHPGKKRSLRVPSRK